MILDHLAVPIVLAPLAGGPFTPELAAAVSDGGGLGFVASGYLSAQETAARIEATRRLTGGDIGVNVFSPADPAEPDVYRSYVERLGRWADARGLPLGTPRHDDDDFAAKLDLLTRAPVAVVSFTFGCPEAATVERLRAAGSEVWVTVTSPAEAAIAEAAGADVLVAQGLEAGGHRATFADNGDAPGHGLLALLALLGADGHRSLVAAGGIATGAALAAVLAAGAAAAQIGTAFMLCPEAGTSEAHRRALRSTTPTALTRAFTGRTARGLVNDFLLEHTRDAPSAYPEIHHVTAPLRRAGRETGDPSLLNLWAGETHALARELPAAEVMRALIAEARESVARAAERVDGAGPA